MTAAWRAAAGVSLLLAMAAAEAGPAEYAPVPGGLFESEIRAADGSSASVSLAPFAMRTQLVTRAEFLRFLQRTPEWRKARISPLLAGPAYLQDWPGPDARLEAQSADLPATEISWFAARAYCASEHARLPTWSQWEYAAAADARQRDARQDPVRNRAILSDMLARSGLPAGAVGRQPANVYGLHDMNSLVWEWVEDFAALFPQADGRNPEQAGTLALCGGSALAFQDRKQYALMMRATALSSLQPSDSTAFVGFRCVRPEGASP